MKTYWGLQQLREVYCPKCGNYLQVVPNGFFHGELFYCPKEKLIFNIILKDITKQAGEEYITQCDFKARKEKLMDKIEKENIEKIEKLLIPTP